MFQHIASKIDGGSVAVVLSSALAIVAGLVALLFYEFELIRSMWHHWLTENWGEQSVLIVVSFQLLLTFPVALMLQNRYFPGAGGTGIPQAIAALWVTSSSTKDKLLSLKIAFGKILILLLIIISGATVGREGPSVHVAACLMIMTTSMVKCPPWLEKRGFIIAGGGAGIAAAFNAPIAGMIFAFEEIGTALDKQNLSCVIRSVVLACVVGVLWLGNYLFYGNIPASFDWKDWWVLPIIAVFCGALGGGFAALVVKTVESLTFKYSGRYILCGVSAGVILSLLSFLTKGLSLGSGFHEASTMLTAGHHYPLWYPLAKAAASFVSLVSLVPGGLFDPALAVGAAMGQSCHAVLAVWSPDLSINTVMILAMIAYFSGVVQSPITCFVIVLEMTGQTQLALPCALTSATAFSVSRCICKKPIYQALASIILHGHEVDGESMYAKLRYDRSVE